jgi:lysozyme family protein
MTEEEKLLQARIAHQWNMASEVLQDIIKDVIEVEGGYVDDPDDTGGATRWGVTIKVARAYGYYDQMRFLPVELARHILLDGYAIRPKMDKVCDIAGSSLAAELIDSGINCGFGKAASWLQYSLNALNDDSLAVDGSIGAKSLDSLKRYVDKRGVEGVKVLTKACNSLQGEYYLTLANTSHSYRKFVYGWMRTRV